MNIVKIKQAPRSSHSLLTTVIWQKAQDNLDKTVGIKALSSFQFNKESPSPTLQNKTPSILNSNKSEIVIDAPKYNTNEPGKRAQSPITDTKKKAYRHAYITIMHGIDETGGYKGYLYNILTMKSRLSKLGSTADFIAMIGFTKSVALSHEIEADLELLTRHGIKLYHLPRFRDVKLFLKVNFMEMALLKVTPWKFTDYQSVQFMDADVLPHRNMDCLFQLNRNSFNTGTASPLNSGWYLALPDIADYKSLVELAQIRMSQKWNETVGWGTPLPPNALQYRGEKKAVMSWNFNGASLDQGLLTHYFVLHQGRVQLFDSNRGFAFDQNFVKLPIELKTTLKQCEVSSPMDMFYHYTGRNKPWLRIHNPQKDRALQYWIKSFDELGLNVTAASLSSDNLKPPLGYFHPNK